MGKDAEASHATPLTERQWEARRNTLAERLSAQRAKTAKVKPPRRGAPVMQGMAQGMRLASEFIGGIFVGGAIGYLIDRVAGTLPIALIVFLMLGFAAGVLNVVRSVSAEKAHQTGDAAPQKAGQTSEKPAND
ncbi:AtpZ/AtpI family protein [Consotaella aegiceratis]|uniref:AtpZ/AtpI family protein n=1 Tax=Consotaella aegiceratis TaxID=3097961 RepID=UPI002F413B4A